SLDVLGDAVQALAPHQPSAVELLDRTFLELVHSRSPGAVGAAEALLLVELEGSSARAASRAAVEAADSVRPLALSVETALEPADVDQLWSIRHAASPILAGLPETR